MVSSQFKDAFITYGYGVVAYFKLVKTMIFVFGVITFILALPQIIANLTISSEIIDNSTFFYSTMISNTGDAYTNPNIVPLSIDKVYLSCENSRIVIDAQHNDEVKLFGIIKKEQYMKNEWL